MLERASGTLLRVPSSPGAADSDETASQCQCLLVREVALNLKHGVLRKTFGLSGNNRDACIMEVRCNQ